MSLERRTPLARVTPLARRAMTRRSTSGDAAWQAMRLAVHSRDGGRCVLCGEFVPLHGCECHHRLLRSRGGKDTHPNLITLCWRCHHDRVHRFPAWSRDVGLMVPGGVDPSAWPVLRFTPRIIGGLWGVPDDIGTWIVRAPHPDQQDSPPPWAA